MWTRQYRKSRTRFIWLPFASILLVTYFYYHAVHGRYGLDAGERYTAEVMALEDELSDLNAERDLLERRTASLRDGTLERDLVDEQARDLLGLARTNELVVLHSSN